MEFFGVNLCEHPNVPGLFGSFRGTVDTFRAVPRDLETKAFFELEPMIESVLKRRTKHFRAEYDYKSRTTPKNIADIPERAEAVRAITEEVERELLGERATQIIANEYLPGQGISRHKDSQIFGDVIVSVSLGGDTAMFFRSKSDLPVAVVLRAGSVIVLSGDSRSKWTHEIPARKSDLVPVPGTDKIERKYRDTRISLTYRTLV